MHINSRQLNDEVDIDFRNELLDLRGLHMVFLIDDSGSMNFSIDDGETRWSGLIKTLRDICSLVSEFSCKFDLNFLTGDSYQDINLVRIIELLEERRPKCSGPLYEIFEGVLAQCKARYEMSGVKSLILFGTDGEQSDDASFLQLVDLLNARETDIISIMVLIYNDGAEIASDFDKIDQVCKGVGVCYDWQSERDKIVEASGRLITYGDYLVKCLFSSERSTQYNKGPGKVCVVCGKDLLYSTKLNYSKQGAKCLDCKWIRANRSPPYCRCIKCGVINSTIIYTKFSQGWICCCCGHRMKVKGCHVK